LSTFITSLNSPSSPIRHFIKQLEKEKLELIRRNLRLKKKKKKIKNKEKEEEVKKQA
jgi:hypothetical protein